MMKGVVQLPERNHRSLYDQMSAEELACVLRADLAASDGSGLDTETLLYVMQLYAARQKIKPPRSAEESYAALLREQGLPQKECRSGRCGWRAVAAAAAALVLVLGVHFVAKSHSAETWEPVCRQNRDYLMVSSYYPEPTMDIPALAQQWYPRWLPEGYERVRELRTDAYYSSFYQLAGGTEEDVLNISFRALTAGQTVKFYNNPERTELFAHGGVKFYLYTNVQRNCAVGSLNGVVIFLEGQISREELLQIICSMPLL